MSTSPSSPAPRPLHVDVTTSKILSLVARARSQTSDEDAPIERVRTYAEDSDERTDSEGDDESDDGDHDVRLAQHESDDENLYADPPQTTTASHSRSRSRTPPPAPHHTRKRRRRHTTRPSNSSASRPSISRTTSSAGGDADAPTDRETRFEKELLTELTCMICFAPMWKPITTPCQHVSVPFISRWPYLFLPHRIICDPMW